MTIRLEVYGTDGRRFEMHHGDGCYDKTVDAVNATREALWDKEVSRVVLEKEPGHEDP